MNRKSPSYWWAPIAAVVSLLLIWQLICSLGFVPENLLPKPTSVGLRLWQEIQKGKLLASTASTAFAAVVGCLVAALLALPLGYLIANYRFFASFSAPLIAASQAIPAVAIAPLLVIWVGYGFTPIVTLCVILVFFPMVLSTVLGLRELDNEVVEAALLDGAAGWKLLRHIQFPLALPSIMTGLRNGFTLSITGAIVGEFVMGGEGLGMVVAVQTATSDTTGLFASITLMCLLAVSIYLVFVKLEELVHPLRQTKEFRK